MGSQMRLSCYTSISISRGASEPGVDLKCVGCPWSAGGGTISSDLGYIISARMSVVGNPKGMRQTVRSDRCVSVL